LAAKGEEPSMLTIVITEVVETNTELNFLRENNCTTFQRYYFSWPLPPADFQDHLKSCILALKTPDCDDTSIMEMTA
jgi:predicted signal transduction protein with EAL and GGDEF domain